MEDSQIIDLYWQREEAAIQETDRKYGKYCCRIANNILDNPEDSAECVNSTYWKAWNVMPPHRPRALAAFLGKITRNLALNLFEKNHAQKRGRGQVVLAWEELEESIPADACTEAALDRETLAKALNIFLGKLPEDKRKIFVSRYWGLTPIREIATLYGMTEGNVKTVLHRTRDQLRQYLEREGISI